MKTFQKPRARKGYVLTHVMYAPDGSVRQATYEPAKKPAKAPALESTETAVRRGMLL